MSEFLKLRKISQDFRRLSSTFLRTNESDGLAYLNRLYNFINQEESIKKYIDDAYSVSDYDCNNFIVKDRTPRQRLNIPDKEADHIKAMYGLLEGLATHTPPVYLAGFSMNFDISKTNRDQAIQAFLDKAFKPLIHYITDSLSKEMMSLEQNIPNVQVNQNIEKVYGTANVGQNIHSINYSGHKQNDLSQVLELLNIFRAEIEAGSLDPEEKEFVLDDLMQINEQIKSDSPDQTRFKKAKNGVKKFLEAVATKAAATAVVSNLPVIIEKGTEFLNRIEQIFQG